jgi:hypothetical protein
MTLPSNELLNAYIAGWGNYSIYSDPQALKPANQGQPVMTVGVVKKEQPAPLYPTDEKNYNKRIIDLFGSKPSPYGPQNCQPKDGLLGVEIECEGENLPRNIISHWAVHNDHSLRKYKGHEPAEYSLRNPIAREDLSKALKYLSSKFISNKSVVVPSQRCSVHVHVNCQQYTMKQTLTFLCLYMVVEDLLVEWCGGERVGNLFCLRARDADHFVRTLEIMIREDSWNGVGSDDLRYTSCNVAALSKFGSLEFRAMRGTTDKDLIELWVDLILSIRTAADKLDSPQDIMKVWDKQGIDGTLAFIFPEHFGMFKDHPKLREYMWHGIRTIRDLVHATKWANPLPPDTKKPKSKLRGKKADMLVLDEDNDFVPHDEEDDDY